MGRKKLNKSATKDRILRAIHSSNSMTVDVEGFKKKINSNKEILEACTFVRVEPIYIKLTSGEVIIQILENHERLTFPNGVGSSHRAIERSSYESIKNEILEGLNQLD